MAKTYDLQGPLPDIFSLRKAIRCIHLVQLVYQLYQQWSDDGKPPESRMVFRPVRSGELTFFAPFWRTLKYRKKTERGRWVQVLERTPAGACARQGNILFIVFRGTLSTGEKITNWMAQRQDAIFDDLEGGDVHRGFHQCYTSVHNAIMSFVAAEASASRSIRITGHSLGAALAVLAAMAIATSGTPFRTLEVFTTGSPRVGSRKWADYYHQQPITTWRIANRKDLVTKIPPEILGYRHVGIPILFTSDRSQPHSLAQTYLPALQSAQAHFSTHQKNMPRPDQQ